MSSRENFKVLLVDDDKNIRQTLSIILKEQHFRVSQASSVPEAITQLKQNVFDWMLTDFRMGDQNGLDLLKQAQKLQPELITIVMTAYATIENAVSVIKEGAFDYLAKPFTNAQLIHLIQKINTLLELKHENSRLKQTQIQEKYFLGFTSAASRTLEEFIRKIAPTDATVLLTGESGTGKTELAKLIHQQSSRSAHPFVTVYCTTLTESLIESELFGHVKGAFTGATQEKVGKFELAEGGTLFLDEIGDLSINAQTKLLRFLQERIFERVGGTQEITVETRILAATNKDLSKAVTQGKFREDLYYRLNVFECYLTPLRYRLEDLPVLIEHCLNDFQKRGMIQKKLPIPAEIIKTFQEYTWPGNIRELRNVLERLVMLAADREVRLQDLPTSMFTKKEKAIPGSKIISLEELSRVHIEHVLSQEDNLEKAAEILGITPVTLWRKRKEYGLC